MYKIVLATVAEDLSGLHLRMVDSENISETKMAFLPKEQCGRIPEDKDPKQELQLFADLLKDYLVKIEINK